MPPVVSDLLLHLPEVLEGDRIEIGALLDALGPRAFAVGIFLFALPNCIPIPFPTGLSTLTGVPLLLLAAQMVLGFPAPRLPGWMSRRAIARDDYDRVVAASLPRLRWIERKLRPRYPLLTGWTAQRIFGAVAVFFALILILPIPGGNMVPGIALTLAALGLMERDGVMMAAAGGVALAALVIVGVVLVGGYAALDAILTYLGLATLW